jgi:2-polyprenyl-3-methyl-5-hydroxy-6-metoxy-1,4-benzoquinol methylase
MWSQAGARSRCERAAVVSPNSPFVYADSDPWNGPEGHRLAEKFTDIVNGLGGVQRVCDLGCGNGYLAGLLIAKGLDVVGVDSSESGITVARAVHGGRGEFVRADIDATLSSKLAQKRLFDVVVTSDVIEHLYRPSELIASARSLLRGDGWLVIGTPYHGYLKNLALSVLGRWDVHCGVHWDGGHIKFFSVNSLSRMVESAGFVVERFEFFGRVPWLWKNMICVARKRS